MMMNIEMKNKAVALNDEQMMAVCGGDLLDLIGDGIGYLIDRVEKKVSDYVDIDPSHYDGTGKQVVPGFNVY